MQFTVDRELFKDMDNFEKDKLCVISNSDYNKVMYSLTHRKELREDRIEIRNLFIIRSTYSNMILQINSHNMLELEFLDPQHEKIEGYFNVLFTFTNYLREVASLKPQLMAKTDLKALGVLYNSEEDKIYNVMQLTVLDEDIEEFKKSFSIKNMDWVKIVDLITSPYVCKFDKMLLSTLSIVK